MNTTGIKTQETTALKLSAIVTFLLAITIASAVVAQVEDAPAATPNLSGVWILNEQDSDDPETLMASMRNNQMAQRGGNRGRDGAGRGGRGMRGGGGPGGGGRGMRAGGPGNGERSGPNDFGLIGKGRDRLMITHSGVDLEIVDAEENVSTWRCDGTVAIRKTPRGDANETATWKNGCLVIERSREDSPGLEQSFSLSEDGKRLVRTIQLGIPTAAEKMTITFAYDMAD